MNNKLKIVTYWIVVFAIVIVGSLLSNLLPMSQNGLMVLNMIWGGCVGIIGALIFMDLVIDA